MKNKCKEALNWFQEKVCAEKSDFCKSIKCCPKECSECIETRYYKTLQELIDNYSKLEKALDKLDEVLTIKKGAIKVENGIIWYSSDKEIFGTWKEWALKESEKEQCIQKI